MSAENEVPALSVIVITPDDYETIRVLIRALAQQTICDRIELVICIPAKARATLDVRELEGFAGHTVIELGELTSSSVARTRGIHAARASVIALSEEHCFPDSTWAEAILARHREPWSGVSPAVVNANPQTITSWANFIIEYGEWADPIPGGEADHIPGHNSTYKRAALLEYGDGLPEILESESPMQWDMQRRGHRFYMEPRAKVCHLNFSLLGASLPLRFWGGRLFAANRARQWSLGRRAAYAVLSPLIPIVRMFRACKALWRLRMMKRLPALFPSLALLLVCDGFGELVGYSAGGGDAMDRLSDWGEFHRRRFMRPNEWREVRAKFAPNDYVAAVEPEERRR